MGQTIKLILKGDNPVIDRRAIVFAGVKPKSKKVDGDKPAEEKKAEPAEEKKSEEPSEEKKGEDVPKVPPKRGGCGCQVAGDPGVRGGALAALGHALALSARRRRR